MKARDRPEIYFSDLGVVTIQNLKTFPSEADGYGWTRHSESKSKVHEDVKLEFDDHSVRCFRAQAAERTIERRQFAVP